MASFKAIYSASQLNRATIFYSLFNQDIGLVLNRKIYLIIKRLIE